MTQRFSSLWMQEADTRTPHSVLELIAIIREIQQRLKRCPVCGERWWYPGSKHILVGREFFVCRCGIKHPTGRMEWARLTCRQRRQYYFSQLTLLWLVGVGLLPPLILIPLLSRDETVPIAVGSFVAACIPVLPVLTFKYWHVRRSLARVPEVTDSHGLTVSSSLNEQSR